MSENREHTGRSWHIAPLVARELLAYSRQPWTYWLRLLSALGAVSVLAVMAMTGRSRLGPTDGRSLFSGSTVILFFIASLNGCARLPTVSARTEGRMARYVHAPQRGFIHLKSDGGNGIRYVK